MMEAYKKEIIEAENARVNLFKWKLFLVAIISGIALGLTKHELNQITEVAKYAIFLIPLVCVYVDVLTRHLQIRILVISEFFQRYRMIDSFQDGIVFRDYEKFCTQARKVFNFEDWAQMYSTYVIFILVIIFTLINNDYDSFFEVNKYPLWLIVITLICSVLEGFMWIKTKRKKEFLKELAENVS